MTKAEALRRAADLRVALLDHGVKRVVVDLLPGRSGSGWGVDTFVGTMGHHIVSSRRMGLTPGLGVVRNGRPDLPGPLCNGYGGFDETARIVTLGWANHPGAGGPYKVERGTVPRNNGRPYFFGWEFEGGITLDDWTDSFREFMARCLAGSLDWIGATDLSHVEHKTWAPGRKIDRLGYTLTQARDEVRAILEEKIVEVPEKLFATGDKPGVDDAFLAVWDRMIARRVYTVQSEPDRVVTDERLAAFLDRLIERVVAPMVREAAMVEVSKAEIRRIVAEEIANARIVPGT